MKDRPLISAERQVAHLAERGVRFDIMGPEDAIAFLRDKNFFFKVKAFAKCFSRYRDPTSENYGRYVNLDFAYLAELTRLDHHLREVVLSMTLDIEHYMKVHLNRAMMDDGADGKEVLDLLFAHERERKERMLEERFDPGDRVRPSKESRSSPAAWPKRTAPNRQGSSSRLSTSPRIRPWE